MKLRSPLWCLLPLLTLHLAWLPLAFRGSGRRGLADGASLVGLLLWCGGFAPWETWGL